MPGAKISVIVPVYNVEPYLRRCLDSIIRQSYRNLEIILVNDGSPDNCGVICDEYAAKDERFKVIHKPNGGVASARNTGLAIATGDWVGWVDSDDWIEAGMFETMLKSAESHSADIVICSREESYPDHCFRMGWQQPELLDKKQAIALLVEDDLIQSYLWDKLWRRELFQDITIPQLEVFEDMAVMYRLFMRAERVVCLPNELYHYEHHETGLTTKLSLESRINFFQVNRERFENLGQDFPQLAEGLLRVLAVAAIQIWTAYYDTPKDKRKSCSADIDKMARFNREHYKAMLENARLGLAGKLALRLTPYAHPWAFVLARWVSRLYDLKHGKPL
jgi:glycosyltransferase involved in cell wall biosynthesis